MGGARGTCQRKLSTSVVRKRDRHKQHECTHTAFGAGEYCGSVVQRISGKVEIKEERGYRIADIQAVSGTILLDQKKSNRVFQKKVQTYMGIASAVTADTDHCACILPGSDMRTGGTLIQYQETDWRFLKRMASQLGLPLVPDTSYYYPRFYLGLPESEKMELWHTWIIHR